MDSIADKLTEALSEIKESPTPSEIEVLQLLKNARLKIAEEAKIYYQETLDKREGE